MGKLRLYQVDFEPSDNFYIEDIESYLNTLPASAKRYEWNNLNYLKLGMNLTIKLPLNQVYQIENSCNYAIIEQDNNTYYYFVVDAKWIAKRTIQLVLTLDTVQTFFTKLKWSDKTQITRETQNRFVKLNSNYYLRKIDKYNEGFNPTKTNRVDKTQINSAIGKKWYLVYMSNPATTQDNTGNPMFMGLLADSSLKIANAGTGTTDVEIPIEDNYIYFITTSGLGDNGGLTIGESNTGQNIHSELNKTKNNAISRAFAVYRTATGIFKIRRMYYTGDTYPYSFSSGDWEIFTTMDNPEKAVIHNCRIIHKVPNTDYNRSITNLDKIDALPAVEVNAGSYPELKTTAYENFDNSNSRLSKIIELPYAPITVTKNTDGTYNFYGCTFNYGYNIMQVISNLSAFIKEDKRIQDLLYVTINNPTATDEPKIGLESKLYSSEFYDYAYYYDTEKQPIRLEDISTNMLNCSINISYNTTSTMNSDKQFYFNVNNGTYNEMQPYEMYLNCARSTEKPILNDSYAEYVKNGYNYDLFNQKRQEKIATINAVISGAQAAVGIGLGSFSAFSNVANSISSVEGAAAATRSAVNYRTRVEAAYNYDLSQGNLYAHAVKGTSDITAEAGGLLDRSPVYKYANDKVNEARSAESKARSELFNNVSGVGSLVINNGINAINSTVNSAMSIESSKRSFSNAVNSRANVPISASGSVPTDLFDNYSSNKLTRYEFTIRPEDKINLFNTFRLTGYAHPVQEKPVFNTRIYSNFVQCKPVFLNSLTEIYKVYLDDISLRFQAGVTVKHNYKGKYDLYDQYENYETIVMEE